MSANIGQLMQQLYGQFGHLPGITIELHKELLAVQVNNAQASATVFLQGAQLTHYQRHGEAPVIWCSEHCDYRQGQSLRGGIPVCWPWFGDIDRNPAAVQQQLAGIDSSVPAHGLVRNRDWQLTAIDVIDNDHTEILFELTLAADEIPLWPYACHLQLRLTIGAQLSVQFTVSNHSPATLHYCSALHSYFAVSAINQVTVQGIDNMPYIDCLDNWQQHQQTGPLRIDQEIDRLYSTGGQPITLHDAGQRELTISTEGSNSSVIWNPWIDKSTRLGQFAQSDYQHMLCIETANALEDCVQLAPGQTHSLQLTIHSTEPAQ